MRLGIPSGWEAVTPEWMTSALADAFPGAEVQEVKVEFRDDGTNRRARLGLSYAGGAGPATVFVKAADPEHTAVNARMGGVFNEPRLFASGVPLPLDHPQVFFTLIDEPRLDFIMVMEDIVAHGCDPRDATRPMTVEQVANGVRGLAHLHSAYWDDRLRRYPQLSWVEPFVSWRGMATGIDIGLERAGEGVPPEVQRLSGKEIMRDVWAPFIGTLATGGQTLLHGDPHIGNTYVLPDNGVGFLDWQVLRTGNPSLDLGYFLQGACTVEEPARRRARPRCRVSRCARPAGRRAPVRRRRLAALPRVDRARADDVARDRGVRLAARGGLARAGTPLLHRLRRPRQRRRYRRPDERWSGLTAPPANK